MTIVLNSAVDKYTRANTQTAQVMQDAQHARSRGTQRAVPSLPRKPQATKSESGPVGPSDAPAAEREPRPRGRVPDCVRRGARGARG
eukprot:4819781-Alexandrium_andersonii.AAC.1